MDGAQVGDLVILIFCVSLYSLYHLWYFVLEPRSISLLGRKKAHLWGITWANRAMWTEAMMSDPKEAIVAVQTARNSVTGVSILCAVNAALASQLLNIVTDPAKLDQVSKFSEQDPITGGSQLVSPEVKIALALGALFLSLLSFAHSIRLSIHLGYMVRVVPMPGGKALRRQSIKVAQRSALYFAIGLRFLYGFMPLIMWLLGALSFLITTIILVVVLFFLDHIPAVPEDDPEEEGLQGGATQQQQKGAGQQGLGGATGDGGRVGSVPGAPPGQGGLGNGGMVLLLD